MVGAYESFGGTGQAPGPHSAWLTQQCAPRPPVREECKEDDLPLLLVVVVEELEHALRSSPAFVAKTGQPN